MDNLSMDGTFSIMQKLKVFNQNKVDEETKEYLKNHFNNLIIEVTNEHEGNIFDLMKKGLLEGWCWQTTQTAILFLNDNSYVKRGYLNLEKDKKYYHSWITFNYNNEYYAFDPCLNILTNEDLYNELFETSIVSNISSKKIKKYFINYMNVHKNDIKRTSSIIDFLYKINPEVRERLKGEIIIKYSEDIKSPMYRNTAGYKAQISDNKILSLTAHFYKNG